MPCSCAFGNKKGKNPVPFDLEDSEPWSEKAMESITSEEGLAKAAVTFGRLRPHRTKKDCSSHPLNKKRTLHEPEVP